MRTAGKIILTLALLFCLLLSSPVGAADQYDVVVIGAGGGGLGAAATLAKGGMKVLLIEQHSKVGGYMSNFQRPPYTFEVSLHALDGLKDPYAMNRPLWKELGILDKVRLVPLDPVYRAIYPGLDVQVPAEPQAYKKLLLEKFPQEKTGIDNLFAAYQHMADAIRILEKQQEGNGRESLKLMAKSPLFFWPMLKYRNSTLSQMLDSFGIKDQKLRALVSWLCAYTGQPPDKVPALLMLGMMTSYYYGGFNYVEGGSQAVSNALAEVVIKNNGQIKLSTRAEKIVIENNRAIAVRTRDGAEYKCRYVVSNANAPDTFYKLVGKEYLPPDFLKRLESLKIGPSIFQVYLGVDHDYRQYFKGAHSISIADTCDQSLNAKYEKEGVPEKVGFVVVNYSVVDPQAAPAGKNVIGITTYLPYDWQNGWREKEGYEKYRALKEETARVFIRRAEQVLPGLGSHVEVMEVGSPRTMEHFTLNPKGSVYGWALDMGNRDRLSNQTPIENLFLAGSWTNGFGQNAVMGSGRTAAKMILEKEKKSKQ